MNGKIKGIASNWVLIIAGIVLVGVFVFMQQDAQVEPQDKLLVQNSPSAGPSANLPIRSSPAPTAAQITIVTLEPQVFSVSEEGAPPIYNPAGGAKACGDGVCDAAERCDTCNADCGCSADEYCSADNGVCYLAEYCGDNTCTDKEKIEGSCCTDCGCTSAQVCSLYSQNCLLKAPISDSKASEYAAAYLEAQGSKATVIRIYDSYLENKAVKAVELDCRADTGAWCINLLLMDADGKVLESYFTT